MSIKTTADLAAAVRTIEHGEKIREPGIYRMPMGWHHGECVDGQAMTGTTAVDFSRLCPAKAKAKPAKKAAKYSADTEIGKATHLLIFEPELAPGEIVPFPHEAWNKGEGIRAECERRDTLKAEGKVPLLQKDLGRAYDAARAVTGRPKLKELVTGGFPELSFITRHPSGVWLKARPDYIKITGAGVLVVDYKTCGDCQPEEFSPVIRKQGWHIKAAWISSIVSTLIGRGDIDFRFVAQETEPPYDARQFPLGGRSMRAGWEEVQKSVAAFTSCATADKWPLSTDEPVTIDIPEWALIRAEAEQNERDSRGASLIATAIKNDVNPFM